MKQIASWWKIHFLTAEFWAAAAGAAAFAVWLRFLGGNATLEEVLRGNRAAIYGTLASIFGALLGFVIATLSILLGFSASDRLAIVRESKHYGTIWEIFTAAIRALALATAVSLVALVIDRDRDPAPLLTVICIFAGLLAGVRILRSVWVLERVIDLVTAPSKARTGGPT